MGKLKVFQVSGSKFQVHIGTLNLKHETKPLLRF